MVDDVTVSFGARIDDLVKAADGTNAAIGSIDKAVQGAAASVGTFGQALIGALSIGAVIEFANGMGKLAAAMELVSQKTGLTVEQVSSLSSVGTFADSSLDQMSTTLKNLNDNLNTAMADGFSQASQAAKILGINADKLTDLPLDQWLGRIADAVAKLNPSLDRTAAVAALGGEGLVKMLPILDKGGKEFDRLGEIVQRSGAIMTTSQAAAASAIKENLQTLQLYASGTANTFFEALQPSITAIANALVVMSEEFRKSVREGGSAKLMMEGIAIIAKVVAGALLSVVSVMQALSSAVGLFWQSIQGNFESAAKKFQTDVENVGQAWMKSMKELGSDGPLRVTVRPGGRGDAGAIQTNLKQGLLAQKEALEAERVVLGERLNQWKLFYDQQASLGRTTEAQAIASTRNMTEQTYQAELVLLQKERGLYGARSVEWERINKQIALFQEKHNTEMMRLNFSLVNAYKQQYLDIFTSIQGAWDSQLRGLLSKQITWAQAFKNILGDLLIEFIKWGEKKLLVYVAGQIAETQASAVGAAARTGIAETEATASIAPMVVKALKSIVTGAAETFAGVFGFMAPLMGPAAAGPAAAASGAVLATAATLPAFDVGSFRVPNDMIARIHKDEMIIPAGPADQIRSGGKAASGGGSQTIVLKVDGATLAKVVAKQMTDNPGLRPGF